MSRYISIILVVLAVQSHLIAGSIWAKAHQRRAIYADDTARAIGDNLTIVIQENSRVANATNRTLEKNASRSVSASGNAEGGNLFNWLFRKLKLPTIEAQSDAETKFEGEAEYDTSRLLSDRVTVSVHDILPNGNMVVVGRRERMVDGDRHIVEVSGIVRPSDVSYENTVPSDMIANFQINIRVTGQESQFTNPGWLSRVLNFLSPW